MEKILAVDDLPENLDIIKEILADEYTLLMATNGELALKIAEREKPDLILLDIMMPGMDGYQVCEKLKANPQTKEIPVVFLTAKMEARDESKGLFLGAVDYITKPANPSILKIRISTQLTLKKARDFLKEQNQILEEKVEARTRQITKIQDVTMVAMGALAETRDPETGNHIRRTQNYVRLLAEKLQDHPRFSSYLKPDTIQLLHKSAPLHDIGKVGVPDNILLKPGDLTPAESEIMHEHTIRGYEAICAAETIMDEDQQKQSFLRLAKEIAIGHHEKWDGSGYPKGQSGNTIPISARLMAIADVYDALISRRVYKGPFSHEHSVSIIRNGRGSHFDPDMTDAFLQSADEFHAIAIQYCDPADDLVM